MDLKFLENKLTELLAQLKKLEEYESVITARRIEADMGDDYRENELAKDINNQHDIWYIRKVGIRKEIGSLRKLIIQVKTGSGKV